MEVLALLPNVIGVAPGQRSSVELWARALAPEGITLHFSAFETQALRDVLGRRGHSLAKVAEMLRAYYDRVLSVRNTEKYDAVLVYREAAMVGPALLERLVVRRGLPLIYQLDDPLHVPYRSPVNGYLSYLKFFGKVKTICRLSTTVIVNSTPIEAFARQYNRNVWKIPSMVDTDRYQYIARDPSEKKQTCVGWSGSNSTTLNLQVVSPVLQALSARDDCSIHLLGPTSVNLPGVDFTVQPWSGETEVQDLRQLDIGLVPVADIPWNHWKFFYKVVQYMALGIPPVCTPIGSNVEVIEHGVTGFLAESPAEWLGALERLVTDAGLRADMSERVAEVAQTRFSLASNADKVIAAFRSTQAR